MTSTDDISYDEREQAPSSSFSISTSERRSLYNVILMGICFLLVFTPFQTTGMMVENVIDSVKKQSNGTYNGDAYISFAEIYVVFAVSNWVAPSIVALLGAKFSMLAGALAYVLYIASFIKPYGWALYVTSGIVGVGASVIWTAQGNYLTLNSTPETMSRNTGIFWALLQCSMVFGNLYEFLELGHSSYFSEKTRITIFIVFTVVCGVGSLLMLFLRKPSLGNSQPDEEEEPVKVGPIAAFTKAVKLFITPTVLILSITFAYSGLELTFFSSIFTNCVGNNEHLADSKSLIGIAGISIGVGEIIGGGLFGLLSSKTNKYGRDPVVVLSFIIQLAAFFLSFLTFPKNCPIQTSLDEVYVVPQVWLTCATGVLLGFGDASLNTQIYSLLGVVFANDSVSAFAIFKFVQSFAAACGFFYGKYVALTWQLLILAVGGFFSTVAFLVIQAKTVRDSRRPTYSSIH